MTRLLHFERSQVYLDENAAKAAKISFVNALTPCVSSSKHTIVSLSALNIAAHKMVGFKAGSKLKEAINA